MYPNDGNPYLNHIEEKNLLDLIKTREEKEIINYIDKLLKIAYEWGLENHS